MSSHMLQITLIAFIISITLIFDFLLSLFLGFIEILTPRRQTETVVGAYPIQNSVPFPTIQVNSTSLDLPSPVRKPMTEPVPNAQPRRTIEVLELRLRTSEAERQLAETKVRWLMQQLAGSRSQESRRYSLDGSGYIPLTLPTSHSRTAWAGEDCCSTPPHSATSTTPPLTPDLTESSMSEPSDTFDSHSIDSVDEAPACSSNEDLSMITPDQETTRDAETPLLISVPFSGVSRTSQSTYTSAASTLLNMSRGLFSRHRHSPPRTIQVPSVTGRHQKPTFIKKCLKRLSGSKRYKASNKNTTPVDPAVAARLDTLLSSSTSTSDRQSLYIPSTKSARASHISTTSRGSRQSRNAMKRNLTRVSSKTSLDVILEETEDHFYRATVSSTISGTYTMESPIYSIPGANASCLDLSSLMQ